MGLKSFHVVFIAAAILLTLGIGEWCTAAYAVQKSVGHLLGAVASIVALAGLLGYLGWFLSKSETPPPSDAR